MRGVRQAWVAVLVLSFAGLGCGNDDGSVATSAPPATSTAATSIVAPTYTSNAYGIFIPPPEATYVVADPETVELVHAFIAAYNSGPDDLASFWTADSELYVENGWATPDRLANPGSMMGQDVARHSPVVMSGRFDEGSTVLVRFWMQFSGGYGAGAGGVWIQEWAETGDTVLRMWVL